MKATIQMYCWITRSNGKKDLSMPMMYEEDYSEYAHAVEYIFTRLDSYYGMMSWN